MQRRTQTSRAAAAAAAAPRTRSPAGGATGNVSQRPSTLRSTAPRTVEGMTTGLAIRREMQRLADDYFTPSRESLATHGGGGETSSERVRGAGTGGTCSKFNTFYTAAAVPRRWHDGPRDPTGRVFDASDRNLLCMDVSTPASMPPARAASRHMQGSHPLCVVGSADHGLKVFDVVTAREVKSLYNKSYGHTEWVTTCKFLPDQRVLSGGMDSKLCLWNAATAAGPARCQDLLGHTGSVSQVDVNDTGNVAVSASYDRTVRLWACDGGREMGCLTGHKASVTQFVWAGSQVLSGDRQGTAKLWDLERATCLQTMTTKRGQIGALGLLVHATLGQLTLLGDQGGVLTVVDPRQGGAPVFQKQLHPNGVLSGIRTIDETPYVVTCGADRRIVVLDPRRGFDEVLTFDDHEDFIYTMETFGPLILSGAGNGWLLVHDVVTGKCCYGLGANQAAVRNIFATPDYLVAAGSDGKAVVYDYGV